MMSEFRGRGVPETRTLVNKVRTKGGGGSKIIPKIRTLLMDVP